MIIIFQTIIKKSKLDQNKFSNFQTNVKNLDEIKQNLSFSN